MLYLPLLSCAGEKAVNSLQQAYRPYSMRDLFIAPIPLKEEPAVALELLMHAKLWPKKVMEDKKFDAVTNPLG